jgi:hypothetical protein
MALPVPFSPALALLLLALPGAWLLGRGLAHAISRDRAARTVLAAGLALALWLLAVHVASLALHSLRKGLPAGTLILAALGIVAEIVRRRRGPLDRGDGRGAAAWMWITMALATAVMAPLALGFHFHDEVLLTGHLSIPAEMQNGIYPPRHLTFPDTPLRYHYGFDLLVAALTALLRLPVDRAIDVATLGLFALSWGLLWTLGERLAGRGRAWLVPLLTLFAGGLPVLCDNAEPSLAGRVLDKCMVGAHYLNPPVTSYFFQHPWSLGIPVGLTTILVFTSRRAPSEPLRLVVLAGLLAVLSMSQMALFAACLPAFVVAAAWGDDGLEPRRGLHMLGVVCAAAVAAKLLGGFLVSAPGLPGLAFVPQAGFGATPGETLLWNAQTFGLLLPLGAAGFVVLRRDRLLFGLLAAGSLFLINAVRYGGSDDIMKYATLATLALGVLSSAFLARLFPHRSSAGLPVPPLRTAAGALLVLSVCLSGLVFALFIGADSPSVPAGLRLQPAAVAPADVETIVWLRKRIRAGEIVYRNAAHTYEYAQWGGLPQPWIQWTARAFGFPPERIAAREKLVRGKPADVAVYVREGFRFFVLDGSREDRPLRKSAKQWIAAGKARSAVELGDVWVVELLGK